MRCDKLLRHIKVVSSLLFKCCCSKQSSRYKKNEKLLEILLMRPDSDYGEFCQALENTNQMKVVQLLAIKPGIILTECSPTCILLVNGRLVCGLSSNCCTKTSIQPIQLWQSVRVVPNILHLASYCELNTQWLPLWAVEHAVYSVGSCRR